MKMLSDIRATAIIILIIACLFLAGCLKIATDKIGNLKAANDLLVKQVSVFKTESQQAIAKQRADDLLANKKVRKSELEVQKLLRVPVPAGCENSMDYLKTKAFDLRPQ